MEQDVDIGFARDLPGMLQELVVFVVGKTDTLLIRKPDEIHLGRETFFRFLRFCDGALVDVVPGIGDGIFGRGGLDGNLDVNADCCNAS